MGASSAAFPPFIVVEMAPLSLSHLIHALENNSALELENINVHVIVSSKYRLVCVCFCNQVSHIVTKAIDGSCSVVKGVLCSCGEMAHMHCASYM